MNEEIFPYPRVCLEELGGEAPTYWVKMLVQRLPELVVCLFPSLVNLQETNASLVFPTWMGYTSEEILAFGAWRNTDEGGHGVCSSALFSRGDPGIPGVQTGITLRHGHQVTPENLYIPGRPHSFTHLAHNWCIQ